MDELLLSYQRMLHLLEEDEERISLALDGEFLKKYRLILKREKEMIETQIQQIKKQSC